MVSIVYASNQDGTRQDLWNELVNVANSQFLVGKAWIVLGDFNQVLNPSEHSCPQTLNVDRRTRDFRDCLVNADLSDLTYRGNNFTWWNKSKTRPIAKKLDRVLVNSQWSSVYPCAYALFGEPDFSDHASCGVTLDSGSLKEKRPFKFSNFLLLNQEFLPLLAAQWFTINVTGSNMLRVSLKLKKLKSFIRKFSKENYSDLEKRVSDAHALLLDLQNRILSDPSASNATKLLDAESKWQVLSEAEDSFLRQRTSISWFKDGDCNSAFFHRMAATRKSKNHIHFLLDSNDVRIDTQLEIREHCVSYFSELLGGEDATLGLIQSDMELLLPFRSSQAQQFYMEKCLPERK